MYLVSLLIRLLDLPDAFADRYISGAATRNFSATALKYAGGLSAADRSQPYYGNFDFDSTYTL